MDNRQLIIVGLVVLGVAALWYAANGPSETTEYDAQNFVINDAQSTYPNADVSILSTNYTNNSWRIKVRVTRNSTSPCPERIHLYYDYPALQFATGPPEYVTDSRCRICVNTPECVILFPEEAMIASHTFPGTDGISTFLRDYPKAAGKAEFGSHGNYSEVWTVVWSQQSDEGPATITAVMDKNGRILAVE